MTIQAETIIPLPAWSITSGDVIYVERHREWMRVREAREARGPAGTLVYLGFDTSATVSGLFFDPEAVLDTQPLNDGD